MLEHQIDDGGDAGGGGDLDGGPQPPGDDLRVDLVDVVLLAQLAVLLAGHRGIDNDDVLQRLRHGVLEDPLERGAVVVELQVVHEQAHLLAVTRIADGLVVHRLDVRPVRLGERAQAAGGVEGLVQGAVELDLLEPLERGELDQPALADRLAGVAVFVDQAVGRPGEGVLEYVVRMLGQGADPQLHRAQFVEVGDELRGGDADEPGREPALRHEGLLRADRDGAHRARHFHVLGQVEVVRARLAGGLGDRDVAIEGQARDHRVHRVLGQVPGEGRRIARVQGETGEVAGTVRPHHAFRRAAIDVRQMDSVTARFG